jgi:hypothetical protein
VILWAPLGRLSAPLPQKFNTPKRIFRADEGCDSAFSKPRQPAKRLRLIVKIT